MSIGRDASIVASLSAADFVYERRISVCLIIGLAAVLAPLLVLFGLRYGVVSTLREDLRRNPTSLELIPLTQRSHDAAFFGELGSLTGVGFLIPKTRYLSASINLRSDSLSEQDFVEAEMVPTAPGDPLLSTIGIQKLLQNQVVLSRSAAEKLSVSAGDVVLGRMGRVVGERLEWAEQNLMVKAVLPLGAFSRDAAFVKLTLLVATEDYREGQSKYAFGEPTEEISSEGRKFASFRLYARTIDDVEPLRNWLAERRIDTDTRLSEIRLVQRLDRSLTILFLIVAGLGGFGFALSLTISLWGSVERKRYELSVLRLLGFTSASLAVFPIVQALLTALGGCAMAGALYTLAAPLIDASFAEGLTADQVVCRLPPFAFGVACLLTVLLALGASCLAGVRAAKFSPAEGLRHE